MTGTELRDVLPPRARHPMTLARTADRIMGGVALRAAVADFVDDLRWARAIVESPAAFRRRGILLGAGMLSRV